MRVRLILLLMLSGAFGINQSLAQTIAAGRLHSLVLEEDGGVVCWGSNGFNQTDQSINLNLERSLQSLEYVINDMTTSWRINECEVCSAELRLLSGKLNRILNN